MKQQKWQSRLLAAFIAVALALVVTPASAFAASFAKSFDDVAEGAWYTDAVTWANRTGSMTGYSGTSDFGPNDNLTRGQAAIVLYRYYGNDEVAAACNKTDVNQDAYYASAVNWAVEKGYINGYSGTNLFGPNDPLTREQLAIIVARAASADTNNVSSAKYDQLANTNQTHDWAKASMVWAVDKGVINGIGGTDLAPRAYITRAQMAQVLENADTPDILPVPTVQVSASFIGPDATYWAPVTSYEVEKGTSADTVTEELLAATPELTPDIQHTSYGFYLSSITKDGTTYGYDATTGDYWQLFVDGTASDYGASSVYFTDNGDSIVFAYSSYGEPLPTVAAES